MLQHFERLGFNKTETKIYLLLAEIGRATANLLAKRAQIPRATCYSILDGLVAKGLVSKEQDEAVTIYVANKPESLLALVDQKRKKVELEAQVASEVVKLITPYFKSKNFSVPRLQFFEGGKNVERMLYDHLDEWFASMRAADNTLWGYQDHTFGIEYLAWLNLYWKQKDPQHKICLYSNAPGVKQQQKFKIPNREIRVLKEDFELQSTLWVSGEFLTMIMTRQRPFYAFQIRDRVFASNLRAFLKLLWN